MVSEETPRRTEPPAAKCDPYDCRQLWFDALLLYLKDATAAARGSESRYAVEALRDLTGSREYLARLCDPIALDVDAVAAGMLDRLW